MVEIADPPAETVGRRAGTPQGLIIVVAAFLPIMAIVALAPAIPSIIGRFHLNPAAGVLVPLMVTAPGLVIALTSPLAGWLCDRYGRRTVLLVTTLFYGFLGMAPLFMTSLGPIFGSRLGLGLCEAGILTATNTLLGDYFQQGRRRLWLTVQGVVGPAFATSVLLASGFLTARAWNGAFVIYGVALAIFAAMVVFIFEPTRTAAGGIPEEKVASAGFPLAHVVRFSLVTLFASSLYYVFIVQIGLAFTAVGVADPKRLGAYISLVSLGVPVGALIFGWLSKRLGPAGLNAVFLALLATGLVGVGLSRSIETAMVMAGVNQLGAGMAIPSLIYWATSGLDMRHRGRGMGMWTSAFFLGQFVSPLGVSLAQRLWGGILPAFVALGAIGLAGAAVSAALAFRRRADLA